MDVSGYSDPYVKLEINHGKKRLKKKKTTVKQQTLCPYYNESFQFQIPMADINALHLVVSVWDYDRLSSNDFIGQVVLGSTDPQAQQLMGNKHWNEMMQVRRPVARWHTLQPKPDDQ